MKVTNEYFEPDEIDYRLDLLKSLSKDVIPLNEDGDFDQIIFDRYSCIVMTLHDTMSFISPPAPIICITDYDKFENVSSDPDDEMYDSYVRDLDGIWKDSFELMDDMTDEQIVHLIEYIRLYCSRPYDVIRLYKGDVCLEVLNHVVVC